MSYRRFTFQAAALLLLVAEYLALHLALPPRHGIERDRRSADEGVNWFGQGRPLPLLFGVGTLLALYALRYTAQRAGGGRLVRVAWYVFVCAAVLPAVWFLVVTDWDNEFVVETACWVGYPVVFLGVPTILFCIDIWAGWSLTAGQYVLRSLLEVVLLMPLWMVCTAYFGFFVLGWGGP